MQRRVSAGWPNQLPTDRKAPAESNTRPKKKAPTRSLLPAGRHPRAQCLRRRVLLGLIDHFELFLGGVEEAAPTRVQPNLLSFHFERAWDNGIAAKPARIVPVRRWGWLLERPVFLGEPSAELPLARFLATESWLSASFLSPAS